MNEKIFGNVGKTLQVLAKIMFYLGEIGAIVCAVIFGKDESGDFNFWFFLFILLVAAASELIWSMMLHAFGEMAENSKRIRKNSDAATLAIVKSSIGDDDSWICPACYEKNEKDRRYCKKCNKYHL